MKAAVRALSVIILEHIALCLVVYLNNTLIVQKIGN